MSSMYEKLFHLSAVLMATTDGSGFFLDINPAWNKTLGWSLEELKAEPFIQFVHPDDREATLAQAARMLSGNMLVCFENRYQCKDGSYRWLSWTTYMDMSEEPSTRRIYATAHDVTAHKELLGRLEAALMQLREALQAMSTPIIPITERIVVIPLIGQMDADRASQVMRVALDGVQKSQVQVVILDVTGLQRMDATVASALVETARALRLLGAQTILTGIQPAVAQTLVGLGLDLTGMVTRGTLQGAIAYAMRG